jgi:hypothetical protein
MLTRSCLTIVASLAVIATALDAQSLGTGTAVLDGVVRDSGSGQPMHKSWVCVNVQLSQSSFANRCGRTDSTGAYRADSIPSGRRQVWVACETVRGLGGKQLASDGMAFDESTSVQRDWAVSSVGCDPRRIRRVTGFFRGHYTPGFESSEFIPCPADGWFIPGDSLDRYPYDNRRAWTEWAPGFNQRLRWPRVPRDRHGNSRFYVRWRGTVVGPGRYGHLGVSAFEIRVDSVMELRAPSKRDCR